MLKRLPESQSVLQVYAVIAVMFSAWTIPAFLWKLPTWLLTLNLGEIFTVFSYAMFTNFMESLIVLLPLLAVCILLPPRILRDHFALRGTILSAGFIGFLMVLLKVYKQIGVAGYIKLFIPPVGVLLLTALLLVFAPRIRFVRSAVLWLSDRLVIFLFILLPLYILLFVYVIARNIV